MAPTTPSPARSISPSLLLCVLVALGSIGCSRDQSAGSTTAAAAIRDASAAETDKVTDSGSGADYRYTIRYPNLLPQWRRLDRAIHEFAVNAKRNTLDIRGDSSRTDHPRHSLDLRFDLARRTSDFVSVLASGSAFTGGAHGLPIRASFNLYLGNRKLVSLTDLFADPKDALQALSNECRHQLEARFETRLREQSSGMTAGQLASGIRHMKHEVETGTRPEPGNFDVFLIDGLNTKAIGLTVIFPPYQVTSYVDGPQQVEVPVGVFYDLLKPMYQNAFAIDMRQADRRNGTGRLATAPR